MVFKLISCHLICQTCYMLRDERGRGRKVYVVSSLDAGKVANWASAHHTFLHLCDASL